MKGLLKLIIVFSFIVALLFIVLIGKKALNLNVPFLGKDKSASQTGTVENTENKIVIPPKAANETEIVLTEAEIQKTIQEYDKDRLGGLTVKIDQNGILAQGKAEMMLTKSEMKIKLFPKVENGKLFISITEAKAGFFNAPNWLMDKINPLIQDYLDKNINNQGQISSFYLSDGKIIIRIKGV
jgi:uncharacterized protein YpmS